ncbi:polysaccharide biosynthesis tyrosine autokinase [Qipengyuania sp. 6B39]|uniref:GumC family protein n=1 Tax=Qipengyuania proteolytica TaxID=2867239 RepID=UPI001C8AFC85|nr:polysaccharide biosynthesis tyrosine autokinase [Qipengyuania proteolytica]MBX7496417.1 polysaccharide biosynthesis tyrosine autokinase [Qipengyuania proteolytica]
MTPKNPASIRSVDGGFSPRDMTDDSEPSPIDIDLRAILAAMRRNLIAIAAILATALLIGVVATLLMVPKFVATSQILVEQQADQIIDTEGPQPTVSGQESERFLQTQVDVIVSRSLAERVVESEGLADNEAFFAAQGVEYPTEEDLGGIYSGRNALSRLREDAAIELLQSGLSVNLPVDSRLVAISFESTDRVVAADIANAVATNFIEANLSRKFDSSAYAREFLGQQLADAREKLERSERELNQYSRAAGLIRVTGQGANADQETTLSVTNDTLVQLNAAASQAAADRIAAENRWRSIASQASGSIPQVLQNPAYQALLRQKSEIEAQLAVERARHLEEHPNVLALEAQQAKINQQLSDVGEAVKRSVRLEYEAARDRESDITGRVSAIRSDALDEQDRGVQYNILKREAETDRALYNTLLTNFNELNATAGATSNNVSLVDLAQPPRESSSPILILNVLVAMILGLIVAGVYVFLREHLDDVVRSPEDVERKLGINVLGIVPNVGDADPQEELADPKSPMSEAYASLVANLRYSSSGGLPRTLSVTSAQAGEGKSTTSFKLATDFAGLGRRTLLVDADLRRPTLHRRFEDREKEGLTAVLAGERSIDEVIVASDRPNLSLVSALPIPVDPSALLSSYKLEMIIEELKSRFDCIVFDAPPTLGLSDSPTISAHMDAVIMVIDASSGRRGAVKSGLRRLSMVNANVLGAVLTKFEAKRLGSEYSYYTSDYYAYSTKDGE